MSPSAPSPSLGRALLAGYTRASWVALASLVIIGAIVGYRWSDLAAANGDVDGLLAFTWALMALLICWSPSLKRDAVLVLAGTLGGTIIEGWGTISQLWTYFTNERPPLWILPAWPIATLSIERLGRIFSMIARTSAAGRRMLDDERRLGLGLRVALGIFVVWMTHYISPSLPHPATIAVVLVMVGIVLQRPIAVRDTELFVAGVALGFFLETWGTTRQCWTYYTLEQPPAVAVVAHGFAAVAFARLADILHRGYELLRATLVAPRSEARIR